MTTKELITQIAAQTGMTKKRTEQLLGATTQTIVTALSNDTAVQLQNFGTLETKERQARQIINPRTGDRTITKPKRVIGFRANDNLKELVK